MNYHGLLDWRLGVSLLRLLAQPGHLVGLDSNLAQITLPELQNWREIAFQSTRTLVSSFPKLSLRSDDDPIPVIQHQSGYKNKKTDLWLVHHPLWRANDCRESNWLTDLKGVCEQEAKNTNGSIKFIDSFNLLRRPGWCYEQTTKA